ncbi:MAG TPA: glycosyltransferase family 2 protein [Candidatus Acidoferrum sp.]|nr:glycosyltransferase family 2 protein [Candidatus Acidoferrum sp.]
MPGDLDLSIVVPLYNEEESVRPLYTQLAAVLGTSGRSYEIICINDGSTDKTYEALCRLADADPAVKVINLRRNFGQTAAMSAGFDHARGKVIIPMDGDLQNDPADIPLLLARLEEGYDVVSGWRRDRQDKEVIRKVVSRIANRLIGAMTGVKLHDSGCSLKAYRAEILKGTRLYGEMHRFIPALANLMGARIGEMEVRHHPRQFGQSKYGLKRTLKVLLDLITVKFLADFSTKPLYMFGAIGGTLFALAVLAGLETLWEKFYYHVYVHNNPVILIAVFLAILGVNFIVMGLLAELIVRTYHESQGKPIYYVREMRNFGPPGEAQGQAVRDEAAARGS